MATTVTQPALRLVERVTAPDELVTALTAPKLRKLQAAILRAHQAGTPITIRVVPVEGRAPKVSVAVEEVL